MTKLPSYIVLEKAIGETPLSCLEAWRATMPNLAGIKLAYAGRLDPMASGKLLVLIGDTCKDQTKYHGLDKEYEFSILFGVGSDSGDVLGIVSEAELSPTAIDDTLIDSLNGQINLPYPHYSARTVQGKPLHTWAIENRLDEITVPNRKSTIYSITLLDITTLSRELIYTTAAAKIELIPPVTDPRKAIGNDFRRPLVRASWRKFMNSKPADKKFFVARLRCVVSSGTYLRSLSEEIARLENTKGLAWSINRTKIGHFDPHNKTWSVEYS